MLQLRSLSHVSLTKIKATTIYQDSVNFNYKSVVIIQPHPFVNCWDSSTYGVKHEMSADFLLYAEHTSSLKHLVAGYGRCRREGTSMVMPCLKSLTLSCKSTWAPTKGLVVASVLSAHYLKWTMSLNKQSIPLMLQYSLEEGNMYIGTKSPKPLMKKWKKGLKQ